MKEIQLDGGPNKETKIVMFSLYSQDTFGGVLYLNVLLQPYSLDSLSARPPLIDLKYEHGYIQSRILIK